LISSKSLTQIASAVILFALLGCASETTGEETADEVQQAVGTVPELQASNAFYYYRNVDKAWQFYRDVLGFETAADYGFAKIMRVAESSYLTLVDAERGMHSADEPKSVTLALVTPQVEGWFEYLRSREVPLRSELKVTEGRPHDGFVAIDPEGYLLEFERFNPHPENVDLIPMLAELKPAAGTGRPPELTIQATIFWLYYRDLEPMEQFYESLLGVPLLVDQGWAKVYSIAGSGFLGLVDGARGLHQASEQKGVTLSFFTDDVEAWFSKVSAQPGIEMRTPEITSESDRVRTFVGYDPEGYYLEWDTFLDVEGNEILFPQLRNR